MATSGTFPHLSASSAGYSWWSLGLVAAMTITATSTASTITKAEHTWHGLESVVPEMASMGLGLPRPVSLMVLVAQRHRNKQETWATTETMVGVCTPCRRLQCSTEFAEKGSLCVLDHSERSRLWLLPEAEVQVCTFYIALTF